MKNEGKEKRTEEMTTIAVYKSDAVILNYLKGRKGYRRLADVIRRLLHAYIVQMKDLEAQLTKELTEK